MKLVELLAKELDAWPKSAYAYAQDGNAKTYAWTGTPEFDGEDWLVTDDAHIDQGESAVLYLHLASDYGTAVVTKKQWQAERDRQKGGEWKRHRGGKCPVAAGTKVSTRHRDGDTFEVHHRTAQNGSSAASLNGVWKHNGDSFDIMSYRIISQPQAEEIEVNVFAGKDVKVEYAYGPPNADMSRLEWKTLGQCNISDIEFDSTQAEEKVKDTNLGTLSYRVEIDTSPAMQALNELSAKWDQVESPFKWRDTINELNAYIEEFTRERDELINRLAEEGFALIPAMTTVMGVADVDMSDWRNWKDGDIVEVVFENDADLPIGKKCVVATIEKPDYIYGMPVSVYDEDANDGSFFWPEDITEEGSLVFKFIRRP